MRGRAGGGEKGEKKDEENTRGKENKQSQTARTPDGIAMYEYLSAS